VNLLVVGVSHHTAPVELLERLSVSAEAAASVLADLMGQSFVNEAVVLSTCNRVEIYATVSGFHGGLAQIGTVLSERAGLDVATLANHLYVHHGTEGVRHAMRVAAGLDSMVVGEAQILGQLRDAYGVAAERDATGRLLHELMQQALRVGKRVHAETDIDRAGQSVVSAALGSVPGAVAGAGAVVVGAGALGGLALATLRRAGAAPLLVTNRGIDRARRLAELHGAVAVDFSDLIGTLSTVDLVVCATASPGPVLTATAVSTALGRRTGRGELTILDLAVPRDVAPDVAALPGVTVIDLARLNGEQLQGPPSADRSAAESIVADEVEAFLAWFKGAETAPTVAALRARADAVVESELRRLALRRPDLTQDQRDDVVRTVHRVVQRLLHSPTVRMRQLASTPGGDQYVTVLRELFDLAVPTTDEDLGPAVDVDGGEPR
jgi:glutamyl-tRNA reductase